MDLIHPDSQGISHEQALERIETYRFRIGCRALFTRTDSNANGVLSRQEVLTALRAPQNVTLRNILTLPTTPQQDNTMDPFEAVFQAMDKRKSGSIEIMEWIKFLESCWDGTPQDFSPAPAPQDTISMAGASTGTVGSELQVDSEENRELQVAIQAQHQTALMYAAKMGDKEAINKAINEGANPRLHDEYGWTALHEAAGGGHVDAVTVLVSNHGADVYSTNNLGWTPLHWAVSSGKLNAVKRLVQLGSQTSTRNKFNESALDMALRMRNNEVAQFLRSVGGV